jgi:flagellar biosynthesis anti-sigma factor FlgM
MIAKGARTMKINGTDTHSALSVYKTTHVQAKPVQASDTETKANPTVHQDRLALSERGRSIADAQRVIDSIPDVRTSLVSEIRNDLQNGTYVVDSQKAAEGLMRESMVNEAAMA